MRDRCMHPREHLPIVLTLRFLMLKIQHDLIPYRTSDTRKKRLDVIESVIAHEDHGEIRRPTARFHETTAMPEKIEMNSTLWARIPGAMKSR